MIKKLSEALSSYPPAGFFTQEIKEKDRLGFELVSLSKQKKILSHANIKTSIEWGNIC